MDRETKEEPAFRRFEIEQYELHIATYEIEARSVADALGRLFQGDGTPFDGSEYIGICEEMGLSLTDDPALAKELRRLGVKLKGTMVPSIRSIREVEGEGDEPGGCESE